MKRPVLFFDWDGTLADSTPMCVAELRLTLQRMGLPPLSDNRLALCNGPTYLEAMPILGIPAEREAEYLRLRLEAELEVLPATQKLFPGVREMLERLNQKAALAVISNGLQEYLDFSIDTQGVRPLLCRVQPMIPGKNKSEALGMLLDEMRPSKAVMIGDRLGDLEAGKANGLPTVAVCYSGGAEEEWRLADFKVKSVAQLEETLNRLLQT